MCLCRVFPECFLIGLALRDLEGDGVILLLIRRLPAIAVAGLLMLAGTASAGSWDVAGAIALGDRHASKLGVVLGWTRPEPLRQGGNWRLMLRHEIELAGWHVPHARNLVEFGYSPVLRLERPMAGGPVFFLEGSIGARLLSRTQISPTVNLSTAFQFSDQLGLGVQWGDAGGSSQAVGVRLQHISNGSIKRPNPGVNFGQVYYRYRF